MLALESQSAMFHWENPITMGIGLIGSQHSINLNEGGLWLHSCDHIIWCVSEAAVLLKVAQTKKMLLGPLEAKLPEMSWPPKLSRKAPPISRSAEKLYLLVPNTREVSWGTKPSCSFHSGARRLPRVLNPTCHCPFAGTPLRFSWWISSRTSACVPSCLESCQGIQLACSIQWEGWKSPLSFYSSQKSSKVTALAFWWRCIWSKCSSENTRALPWYLSCCSMKLIRCDGLWEPCHQKVFAVHSEFSGTYPACLYIPHADWLHLPTPPWAESSPVNISYNLKGRPVTVQKSCLCRLLLTNSSVVNTGWHAHYEPRARFGQDMRSNFWCNFNTVILLVLI